MTKIAELIYEAARLEALWSKRPVIPEEWEKRDEQFKERFTKTVESYLAMETLPTPQEVHEAWRRIYSEMGWRYGDKRDPEKKTHPDLVPFDQLPKEERDKDAIFLALVWLARAMRTTRTTRLQELRDKYLQEGGKTLSPEELDEEIKSRR
jgi:hypothetical protein